MVVLVHQHGRRFIVLEHQYGCRDVMSKDHDHVFAWKGFGESLMHLMVLF